MKSQTFFLFLITIVLIYPQSQQTIEWPSLADSPWPMFRGDAQSTGRSQFTGPSEKNIVWTADLPYGIVWGPTIGYGDKLYFGTNSINTIDTLNPGNFLYAYNPDGTLFWRYNNNESGVPNWMPPLAANDSTIYFGSNSGYFYALDYFGNLKWKLAIPCFIYSSISKNGDLYITCETGDTVRIVSHSGEIKLIKYFNDIVGPISFSTDGSQIYFRTVTQTNSDKYSNLYCTDTQFNILWDYKFGEESYGYPAIDNQDNIYVFGNDSISAGKTSLYSFNKLGEVQWKFPVRSYSNYASPTIDIDGNIIFHHWDNRDGESLNVITSINNQGELKWEYFVEKGADIFENASTHGLVSDAQGNVYFGSTGGTYFWALNKKGELMWKIPLNGYEFDSSPAIGSDGTLYIATQLSITYQSHEDNLIAVRNNPNFVEEDELPDEFYLFQNYPNPFNPTTTIKFSLPQRSEIKLTLYNMLGQKVDEIYSRVMAAGSYEYLYDANGLSSGVYIYVLESGNLRLRQKMVLLK